MQIEHIRHWYRSLPEKKRYIELLTAVLTVPVLITVLIANVRNINTQPQKNESISSGSSVLGTVRQTPTPTFPVNKSGTTDASPSSITSPEPSHTPQQCNPAVGNPTIKYPKEGEVVTGNPVCIDISIEKEGFCSVVWSYRINNSAWSEFTDKSFCIYDLSPGQKQLEVRIKSIVSGDEVTRSRTFLIPGMTATPTPESSPSASY